MQVIVQFDWRLKLQAVIRKQLFLQIRNEELNQKRKPYFTEQSYIASNPYLTSNSNSTYVQSTRMDTYFFLSSS